MKKHNTPILLKHILTNKTQVVARGRKTKVFQVATWATKHDIAQAANMIFPNIKIDKINVLYFKRSTTSPRNKKGFKTKQPHDYRLKKAYIQFKEV